MQVSSQTCGRSPGQANASGLLKYMHTPHPCLLLWWRHYVQKWLAEEGHDFRLSGHNQSPMAVKTGTRSSCRTLAGLTDWLVPDTLISLHSYNIQDHQARVAPPTVSWPLLCHTPIKKHLLSLHTVQPGRNFSTERPLSQKTLACIKLEFGGGETGQ